MGTSIFGSEISEPPFFANGAPECMKTNATSYAALGRKPARNNGTRLPSVPSTGFTFSPATSAERILAPVGSATLRNGCLILHAELHFREGTPFIRHQRRNYCVFEHCCEYAAVRETCPSKRQAWLLVRLLVIAKCCLQGKASE